MIIPIAEREDGDSLAVAYTTKSQLEERGWTVVSESKDEIVMKNPSFVVRTPLVPTMKVGKNARRKAAKKFGR